MPTAPFFENGCDMILAEIGMVCQRRGKDEREEKSGYENGKEDNEYEIQKKT